MNLDDDLVQKARTVDQALSAICFGVAIGFYVHNVWLGLAALSLLWCVVSVVRTLKHG